MRVLVMMSSVAVGGAERNVASVMPYLKNGGVFAALGTLNTRRDSALANVFAEQGIPRFNVGARRLPDPPAWKRFLDLIHEQKFDIIHTQDQDTHIYGALAHRYLGIPTVMTRHVMEEPADTLRHDMRRRLVLWAAHYGLNQIIAVSEAVRQQFARQSRVPLTKIETIYNGINVAQFETGARREAKRAEMGWALDRPIVAMVAVMRPGKGHEVLFEAIPQIKRAIPNVQIKLIGDGELRGKLTEQAAPYGDTVEFLGARMDVPELLGTSDVLALPSWSEALPNVLIEAGAASLPVVATNVGGVAEIVEDGIGGYLVAPGNAAELASRLIDVLQDTVRARAMGRNARQRIEQTFVLSQQANRTIALYERLLSEVKH